VLGLVRAVAGQIVAGAGAVVGYRNGTQEPNHSVEKLTRTVEIRRYDARIAAQTTVSAGEFAARNAGFRRLARYIFGANQLDEKIAMTAPVSQEAVDDRKWVIRFFMPADKSRETLPEPDDSEVKLIDLPPQTLAVRRFSGSISARAVAAQTAELMNTLRDIGFEAVDTPEAWFYDPPWTVPVLRRNEIAVPVEPVR
jgi:SOUL heme-binding protein